MVFIDNWNAVPGLTLLQEYNEPREDTRSIFGYGWAAEGLIIWLCFLCRKVKFSSLVWRTDQQTDVMAFESLLVSGMKLWSNYAQYLIKLTEWLADWAVWIQ